MLGKQAKIIQTPSMPLAGWYLRWIPWVISGCACVGYLSGVLTTQPLTLLSLLLLTGTYGAWLAIYHLGVRRFKVRAHPGWLLILFCLACASQFIPEPATNVSWLPLLPLITASFMMMITPRSLGLLAAGALCLSSYLAILRLVPDWDVSSQVGLLLSFLSLSGYAVIIRELALAHRAKDVSNAELAAANSRLQEYSAQVEELSAIRERNRIAREIHDTLGHALTLLAVQLETATQLEARGDPRLHEKLLEARQVTKACLTLYRCAQEALTNMRKHAHATKVLLRLSTSDGEEGQVELTVLDNGQRCEPSHEQSASGFGLLGMGERVALLDGRLWAGPQPGHGWRVEVVLPLKQREQAEGIATRSSETREKV